MYQVRDQGVEKHVHDKCNKKRVKSKTKRK